MITGDIAREDCISLHGLLVRACHGVLPEEAETPQPFIVDLDVYTDLRYAGQSDDLAQTICYADLAKIVQTTLEGKHAGLLEHLAEKLAEKVLGHRHVEAVRVKINKPEAPIMAEWHDQAQVGPSVSVFRAKEFRVVFGLGSNLGDRQLYLRQAIAGLQNIPHLQVDLVSELVSSPADVQPGQVPAPDYLNCVVVAHTQLSPFRLLEQVHAIENRMGRERSFQWAPRIIDIDIVRIERITPLKISEIGPLGLAENPQREEVVLQTKLLTLPHPYAHKRAYWLMPWAEIEKQAKLYIDGQMLPIDDALLPLVTMGSVRWGPSWEVRPC